MIEILRDWTRIGSVRRAYEDALYKAVREHPAGGVRVDLRDPLMYQAAKRIVERSNGALEWTTYGEVASIRRTAANPNTPGSDTAWLRDTGVVIGPGAMERYVDAFRRLWREPEAPPERGPSEGAQSP